MSNTVALKYIHIEKKQSIKNFSIWPKNSPKTLSLYPWLTKWTSRLLANAALDHFVLSQAFFCVSRNRACKGLGLQEHISYTCITDAIMHTGWIFEDWWRHQHLENTITHTPPAGARHMKYKWADTLIVQFSSQRKICMTPHQETLNMVCCLFNSGNKKNLYKTF